jgi:hypothetical protein
MIKDANESEQKNAPSRLLQYLSEWEVAFFGYVIGSYSAHHALSDNTHEKLMTLVFQSIGAGYLYYKNSPHIKSTVYTGFMLAGTALTYVNHDASVANMSFKPG